MKKVIFILIGLVIVGTMFWGANYLAENFRIYRKASSLLNKNANLKLMPQALSLNSQAEKITPLTFGAISFNVPKEGLTRDILAGNVATYNFGKDYLEISQLDLVTQAGESVVDEMDLSFLPQKEFSDWQKSVNDATLSKAMNENKISWFASRKNLVDQIMLLNLKNFFTTDTNLAGIYEAKGGITSYILIPQDSGKLRRVVFYHDGIIYKIDSNLELTDLGVLINSLKAISKENYEDRTEI